eukprot:CAMPEP_0181229784 /NCGR_PEP_ID=MMETSP1096-20121128/34097_1 /TAXON_ID=156174 ORGANISM="Chrysochromulina ericina, Strain CCMP281" /NCGR_SAMPLE_ID=MMETSP1096 /ASSEMBLY_ACC=CAM_ASM_000453 /LENGTH=65 /DNA_ID=CAMNT_0023323461 /DNA_START=200 /DNA_END=394 /DNA_ORIENTATION=-
MKHGSNRCGAAPEPWPAMTPAARADNTEEQDRNDGTSAAPPVARDSSEPEVKIPGEDFDGLRAIW